MSVTKMSVAGNSSSTFRVKFDSLPINVFDNSFSYTLRLFLKNPNANIDTPLTDSTYAGRICVYNNSAHSDSSQNDSSTLAFVKAGTDVTETVTKLGLNDVSSDDFKVLVIQGNKVLEPDSNLLVYFKPEVMKINEH